MVFRPRYRKWRPWEHNREKINQEGMKGGDGNLGEMREEANFICLATVGAISFDKHE